MCAIGGVYLKDNNFFELHSLLNFMLQVQRHRGPDSEGLRVLKEQNIGLCHNRLSIQDLSPMGNQPMFTHDGNYAIVFNGEIYNHNQLRLELVSLGCKFKSKSDTEVILEGYRVWGEGVLDRLSGMFAFALFDVRESILFCARDKIGKKPFVYADTLKCFAFSSEVPALYKIPDVDLSYDKSAVAAMLLHNLRHIPDPSTAYNGIKKLRPGHAMIVKNGVIKRIWRYWTPLPSSENTTPEVLLGLLDLAVKNRMQADVPVAALLSGGIDSSAIVALMKKYSKTPIKTYALGLDRDDEDLKRARVMSDFLGTNHKEVYFNPESQLETFKKIISIHGEPIMLLPLLHTYSLCQVIHNEGTKVVMTGNGADELFYGYTGHIRTYKVSNFLDHISFLRPLLKPLNNTKFSWLASDPGFRKANYYKSLSQHAWSRVVSKEGVALLENKVSEEMEYWGPLCQSDKFIDESNFVGLMVENTHSVTIAGDLPAMASAIETRSPFLDQSIVSFALATPVHKKIPNIKNPLWLKAILRDAVKDLIPEDLLKAPKRGFGMGIQEDALLRGAWKHYADDLLSNPLDMDGFFSAKAIRESWANFLNGNCKASLIAKDLAIQAWLRNEIDKNH